MAATNAYYAVVRIPGDGGESDDASYTGTTQLASGTSATFKLKGGKYGMDVVASTYGTVTLQRLAQDGSTWLNALTAFSANGTASVDLPPGDYRVSLA